MEEGEREERVGTGVGMEQGWGMEQDWGVGVRVGVGSGVNRGCREGGRGAVDEVWG